MIFDNINNYDNYEGLNDKFKKAFEFLKNQDLKNLATGKYEIQGNEVFALVQEYETKILENTKYEAHEKYIDIQYMVEGKERIGYSLIDKLQVEVTYNEATDFTTLVGTGNLMDLSSGEFFVFFPQDGHMPGIFKEEKAKVRKVVIKILK